ncbi:MAG: hypothetical protein HY665_00580 [Chloroflexi bacterium]|nr:hypothetical protein [Chloroflexota bacterium]
MKQGVKTPYDEVRVGKLKDLEPSASGSLEAEDLARRLFRGKREQCACVERLAGICDKAKNKDFLIIHNPGGWGGSELGECLEWEQSIVKGVSATVEKLGYSWLLMQYFRGGSSWWAHTLDMREQLRFFFEGQSSMATALAAELGFIARRLEKLNIVLVGVSQGAAFSNAVMRQLNGLHRVYSIELGLFFPHMSRRVITERTLAIDSNGVMPDPVAQRNLKVGFEAYITAPGRWIKYRWQGKPQKLSYCINVPGHDYSWEYIEVCGRVEHFFRTNFGEKEVGI